MQFLTPLAFLGALLAIPILLLYMLRLRRREVVVSSNFLWQQILRDREANTPWQRLRRNILLFLQLLILALLVLALARPAQIVPTISAGKTVILLDASASMNATDVNGQSRFAAAQEQARQILAEINTEDQVSIIRVADATEPLIGYSNDINALRAAINNALPGQGGGDWDTALTLAAAGAEGTDDFRIVIISDGGVGDTAQLPDNIPQPVYVPVGASSQNLAITALATRALPGQAPQLFALVENYGAEEAEISLVIRLDGELWDSVTRTVSAQSQRSFIFTVEEDFDTIQADLVLDDEVVTDYLAQDNNAYAVQSAAGSRRVLLISEQSNIFLEQVLRSLPGVQVFRGDTGRTTLPEQDYDLYIFNGWLPSRLPDADMLIINPPASSDLFTLREEREGVRDVAIANRAHPLMAFLNVDNLNVRAYRGVSNTDWGEALITIADDPLVIAGEEAGRQLVLLPFNLLDTDLPLQIAWPLLMSNALEWFAPANIISGGTSFNVGETVRLNPPVDAASLRVTLPSGQSQVLPVEDGAGLSFIQTMQPGLYQLEILDQGGTTLADPQYFAINLFGAAESDITPATGDRLQIGGGIQDTSAGEQLGFREFWPVLLGLALLVLLYEWYVYYRRLQVPTEVRPPVGRTTARQ